MRAGYWRGLSIPARGNLYERMRLQLMGRTGHCKVDRGSNRNIDQAPIGSSLRRALRCSSHSSSHSLSARNGGKPRRVWALPGFVFARPTQRPSSHSRILADLLVCRSNAWTELLPRRRRDVDDVRFISHHRQLQCSDDAVQPVLNVDVDRFVSREMGWAVMPKIPVPEPRPPTLGLHQVLEIDVADDVRLLGETATKQRALRFRRVGSMGSRYACRINMGTVKRLTTLKPN
ncbi:hypothetical protein HDG32_001091 [Paraburkholderia sp. CI2]|nr:hypothetical protein [Paraburkholderia sp. CI2]